MKKLLLISLVFRAPSNHNFWDYFMIELRQNDYDASGTGDHCHDGYIYIDEVALEEVDQCGKVCSPSDLGPIQHSTVPNVMITNSSGTSFTMLIKNATGINFTVYDTGGLEIYNQNAYDPNGLVDVGYSDYYFSWTGQKPDGSLFPSDVYAYTLRLWNCDYEGTFLNSLSYFVGTGSAIQGYDIQNTALIDCCPNILEIQNKEYVSGLTIEKADISITAGENFTASFPIGPVVLHNGSDVKYVSNTITILPGFSVEPGAQYHAISTGICPEEFVRSSVQARTRDEIKEMKSSLDNTFFNVAPNPSNDGKFNIITEMDKSQIERIVVYNSLGQVIQSNIAAESSLVIDLTGYSNGVYFVKVKLKNDHNIIINKLILNK